MATRKVKNFRCYFQSSISKDFLMLSSLFWSNNSQLFWLGILIRHLIFTHNIRNRVCEVNIKEGKCRIPVLIFHVRESEPYQRREVRNPFAHKGGHLRKRRENVSIIIPISFQLCADRITQTSVSGMQMLTVWNCKWSG